MTVASDGEDMHGTVLLSDNAARPGDRVTVTVTPDEGYKVTGLSVTDSDGRSVTVLPNADGTFTFIMPEKAVSVKPIFAPTQTESGSRPFLDVPADAYYADAVAWAVERGITNGLDATLFGPDVPCTRAQMVTFLWRAAGMPEPSGSAAQFTDVTPGSYYEKAVRWALEQGITKGVDELRFDPDAIVNRAQTVTFLYRFAVGSAVPADFFEDVPADAWFAAAVAWAAEHGITNGTSETTFSPDENCVRAQIVTFLYRYFHSAE